MGDGGRRTVIWTVEPKKRRKKPNQKMTKDDNGLQNGRNLANFKISLYWPPLNAPLETVETTLSP
ncbi:hypothetical protein E2C01_005375 [Portunus trituberculatus]|uniref:Uncharacterized protein n=1 Tax=Portunus trituberculatus TaxID=210409 RepID=A0A5B7CTC5_PORTR|nr:hypothetical protein [Portunus trituberculatus]